MIKIIEKDLGLAKSNFIKIQIQSHELGSETIPSLIMLYSDEISPIHNGDGNPLCLKLDIPSGLTIEETETYVLENLGLTRF